ncbi:MAG: xanthine dehydrogenase family protein [Rhizobiaceae bacterium]|nr:xanthine dehydrogenase family protein [Rhizobiaceae bacterium]
MKYKLGAGIRRVEDERLVRGAGTYLDDIHAEGALRAVFVRSPHAHAAIERIDTQAASMAAGVVDVVTYRDVDSAGLLPLECLVEVPSHDSRPMARPPRLPLARDRVRHVGEPVAMIVAVDRLRGEDAAEEVIVDYAPLPAVTAVEAAVGQGALALWQEAPGNLCFDYRVGDAGGVDRAMAAADRVVSLAYPISRVTAFPLETRGAIAFWHEETERYEIVCGHQKPHQLKRELARQLGVEEDRVRVVVPADVGGGFGLKGGNFPEYALLLLAARRLKRPVRWSASRSEAFLSDDHGRDSHQKVRLALDAEGHFLALDFDCLANLGAYLAGHGPTPAIGNLGGLSGMYRIPAIAARVRGIFTNTQPLSPYRGAGRPEATYAIERLVDIAAAERGEDPVALRRRNLIPAGAMPYDTGFLFTYDSGDFEAVLDMAVANADFAGFPARRRASAAEGKLRGIGIACAIEQAGQIREETARIELGADGSVELYSGTVSNGQGHATAFRQLVGELLPIDVSAMVLVQGDTDRIAQGTGTYGSRSLSVGGAAAEAACRSILDQARRLAADELEVSEIDIQIEEGRFRIAGTDRSIGFSEIVQASGGLRASSVWQPAAPTFPNGVHVCELEIDPETGGLEVLRYTVVDDVGRVVNPLLVAGQIHGGVAQGLGQALGEQIFFDAESAQLLTTTPMDYFLPRAATMPSLSVTDRGTPARTNPLGIKGVGEAGTVGSLVAVVNAAVDALAPLGIRHLDMPLTPMLLWDVIRAARSGRA